MNCAICGTEIDAGHRICDICLKEEAKAHGKGLHESQKGFCTCVIGRDMQEKLGREKCKRYDFWRRTKSLTYCKRKCM